MSMHSTLQRVRRLALAQPVLATIGSVALAPLQASAAAAETGPGYTTQVRTDSLPTGPGYAAAYVDCPAGSLAITSGQVGW
jgi:hypothetical protein